MPNTPGLTLKWGLQPPPEAIRAWGMRAQYDTQPHPTLTWCGDRTSAVDPTYDQAADTAAWIELNRPFNDFLTGAGWTWLEQHVRATQPSPSSEHLMVHSEPAPAGGTFVLEASMRRSFGYVFIVVYELPAGVQPRHADTPTPTPPPPAKRRARSRVRINQFTGRPSPR